MKNYFLSIVLTTSMIATNAFADIYKRVDADGHTLYTSEKTKGATLLIVDPEASAIANDRLKNTSKQPSSNKRTATPEGFPKVDKQTQNQRDGKRQEILQNELDSEKAALEEAKKAYAEGEAKPEIYKTANGATMRNVPKFQEKMKSLQDDVDSHENNIKLLQKELDNLH
jgi:chromosome segregation ATPase